MFFSVIVPVYNVEKYLRECVDSILKQTFTDFELLLVDDGSTDSSPEICDDYAAKDERVKVIHNKNGGASVARNTGMKAAKGQYLINIDSDDCFLSDDIFEKLYNNSKDKDIILFKYQKYFDDENRFEKCPFSYSMISEDDSFVESVDKLVKADAFFGMAWMKTIKRDLVADNDIYFEEGIVAEDIDWNYRLYCSAKSLTVIDESFIAYRQRANSVTSAPKIKSLTSLLYIIEKWADIINDISDETLKKALLGSLSKHYSNTLIAYTRIKDTEKKAYKKKLKEFSWLLNYGLSLRPKLMGKICSIFGLNITVLAVGVLDKIK